MNSPSPRIPAAAIRPPTHFPAHPGVAEHESRLRIAADHVYRTMRPHPLSPIPDAADARTRRARNLARNAAARSHRPVTVAGDPWQLDAHQALLERGGDRGYMSAWLRAFGPGLGLHGALDNHPRLRSAVPAVPLVGAWWGHFITLRETVARTGYLPAARSLYPGAQPAAVARCTAGGSEPTLRQWLADTIPWLCCRPDFHPAARGVYEALAMLRAHGTVPSRDGSPVDRAYILVARKLRDNTLTPNQRRLAAEFDDIPGWHWDRRTRKNRRDVAV